MTAILADEMFLFKFLCLMLLLDDVIPIRIATYNIWNVMFNWEVRQLRISQLVSRFRHVTKIQPVKKFKKKIPSRGQTSAMEYTCFRFGTVCHMLIGCVWFAAMEYIGSGLEQYIVCV